MGPEKGRLYIRGEGRAVHSIGLEGWDRNGEDRSMDGIETKMKEICMDGIETVRTEVWTKKKWRG